MSKRITHGLGERILTYPQLVPFDKAAVVASYILRVALGEMRDFLLNFSNIVVRVFKV